MKPRVIKAAIAAAALLGLVSLVLVWLGRQGASAGSLITGAFWSSQWALAGSSLGELARWIQTAIPGLGTLEWLTIGGGAVAVTGILVVPRLLRRQRTPREKKPSKKKPSEKKASVMKASVMKASVVKPGGTKQATRRRELVLRLATRGKSAEVIARDTGLSRDAVRSIKHSRAMA